MNWISSNLDSHETILMPAFIFKVGVFLFGYKIMMHGLFSPLLPFTVKHGTVKRGMNEQRLGKAPTGERNKHVIFGKNDIKQTSNYCSKNVTSI